jgi:hypothetical protein
MKLRMKALSVGDLETLQRLVVENIDAVEPGLAVVDSRLLLGHAAIDLVARDADGTLVLMALGFKTDESLLLRIVEAYSWCLEYPDAVRGHYPSLELSEDRPPRVVFIVERLSDSFQRKIKQLNLGAVDAFEFRYIDVNGVPAVYFDAAVRIRRTSDLAASFAPASPRPGPRSTPEPAPVRVPSAISEERIVTNGNRNAAALLLTDSLAASATRAMASATDVVPGATSAVAGATSAVAGATSVEPAPAIAGASDVSVLETVSSDLEIESVIATLEPTVEAIGFTPAVLDPEPVAVSVVDLEPVALTLELEPVALAVEPEPVADTLELEPVALAVEPERVKPTGSSTAPAAGETAAPAARVDEAANQKYLFAEAARASQIAKEFGIQLPKDGALTRQWVDFLNQLAGK